MTDDFEETRVIPVIEEELVAETEPVKTGSVRVQKHVQKSVKRVSAPVKRETAEVRRVAVNKVIDAVPKIRTSGDTIIVPVVEEEIVVTKRLVLKEELHITRRQSRERITQDVTLRRERAEIQRLDANGRIVDETPRPAKRRGMPG